MARYIDVEALKNDGHPCWHDGEGNIYYEVDHAPTADVVEVVRCKDCKHNHENGGDCDRVLIHTLRNLVLEKNEYLYYKLNHCEYGERSDT